MDKYEELAHEIIDKIQEAVMELYDIKPKALDDEDLENPALINGEKYFNLEAEIAGMIRRFTQDDENREV